MNICSLQVFSCKDDSFFLNAERIHQQANQTYLQEDTFYIGGNISSEMTLKPSYCCMGDFDSNLLLLREDDQIKGAKFN